MCNEGARGPAEQRKVSLGHKESATQKHRADTAADTGGAAGARAHVAAACCRRLSRACAPQPFHMYPCTRPPPLVRRAACAPLAVQSAKVPFNAPTDAAVRACVRACARDVPWFLGHLRAAHGGDEAAEAQPQRWRARPPLMKTGAKWEKKIKKNPENVESHLAAKQASVGCLRAKTARGDRLRGGRPSPYGRRGSPGEKQHAAARLVRAAAAQAEPHAALASYALLCIFRTPCLRPAPTRRRRRWRARMRRHIRPPSATARARAARRWYVPPNK